MNITSLQIKQIYPLASLSLINLFLPFINKYSSQYLVNTPLRMSAFLAQIGHESGQLNYTEEIASGAAYEGRQNLGNLHPGDGRKYKGRGLIQLTGEDNYSKISRDFGIDFVMFPAKLSEPEWAVRSAYWFWSKKNLNLFADISDFQKITRIINGGLNGYKERCELYERAKNTIKF